MINQEIIIGKIESFQLDPEKKYLITIETPGGFAKTMPDTIREQFKESLKGIGINFDNVHIAFLEGGVTMKVIENE